MPLELNQSIFPTLQEEIFPVKNKTLKIPMLRPIFIKLQIFIDIKNEVIRALEDRHFCFQPVKLS